MNGLIEAFTRTIETPCGRMDGDTQRSHIMPRNLPTRSETEQEAQGLNLNAEISAATQSH